MSDLYQIHVQSKSRKTYGAHSTNAFSASGFLCVTMVL